MEVGGEKLRRGSPPFGTFLEEEIFKEEEMAWFLQYQIDDDCGGGRICGEGCLFAAPIVDEAEEGEEQRIDVKLGQGMIREATEKVKMMDPAPIIAAAIINKAAEEEQRIDVELGQGNPEETVMESAPIVDEAAEGEEQRIDMELGQEMVGEASSVEATLMDSREKTAAVARRRSVIGVEEKAGSSFSPIWKRNQKNQKARRGDEHDPQSEDAELETELRKDTRRQAAQARRRRAAEVHNLSERKRRDRINEKMKTLQNLVPRCNKTNKASMLNDAIEYLKSLKLHIQMMSTGFNMRPMIFPGAPSYFPPMTTGPMTIGTSLNTGLNPLMQCGPLLPTGSLSHTTLMPSLRSSSIAPGQQDPSLNHINAQRPCMVQIPNYTDINQHYVSHHQPQTSFQAKDPTIINQQQL